MGTEQGEIVGVLPSASPDSNDPSSRSLTLAAFDLEANHLRDYFMLPYDWTPSVELDGMPIYDIGADALVPRDEPAFAAAKNGRVYAAPAGAYQVAARAPDGTSLWALRVTQEPTAFEPTPNRVDALLSYWRRFFPALQESDVNWPAWTPAVERLEVDGRGNVYVVPWIDRLPDHAGRSAERPVDVYSPEGERLFAGWMPDVDWSATAGDQVYVVDEDPESGEQRVVRYRLVMPF